MIKIMVTLAKIFTVVLYVWYYIIVGTLGNPTLLQFRNFPMSEKLPKLQELAIAQWYIALTTQCPGMSISPTMPWRLHKSRLIVL